MKDMTQTELVSVFTAYKCVALQDFARDRREVRVAAVVIDQSLSDQAGEDIYKIEQFTGSLQMVTGQSIMLETPEKSHPVIYLNEIVDLILTD